MINNFLIFSSKNYFNYFKVRVDLIRSTNTDFKYPSLPECTNFLLSLYLKKKQLNQCDIFFNHRSMYVTEYLETKNIRCPIFRIVVF